MKRRVIRWGIAALLAGVLAVATATVLQRWMNGSSTSSVRVGTPVNQTRQTVAPPVAPITVTNAYYTTMLPSSFSVKRQTDVHGSGPIQSQFVANTSSEADQQVGITIGTLPSEGLAGVAAYHLRATDTGTYQAISPASMPAGAAAFRTIQGPAALTVFWPHGDQYAELTVSTEGRASWDAILAAYNSVIAGWQWK